MTNPSYGQEINRRDLLKTVGVTTAAGMIGIPAISGSVAADHASGHPGSTFEMYGVDHFASPPRLVTLSDSDLIPPTDPDNSETTVSYIDVNLPVGTSSISLNTLAAHPSDGMLYGTDVNSNKAFEIDPTTGDLTFIGNAYSVLGGIAASAMILDDSDNPVWYGITHGGVSGGNANKIWEIDLISGEPTNGAQLTHDDSNVTATHVGMGVNFLSNELWGVIADPQNTVDSNVFRVLDPSTGAIDIVNASALTGGRSVGATFGPCANIMFAMRQGSEFYGYDVSDDTEYDYGTLVYSPGNPTDFDSLAVPYGYECAEICDLCEFEDSVKFEYVFEEEDDVVVTDGFYPEDAEDFDAISFVSYESKEGEDYEPVTVVFKSDICSEYLTATVKAGREDHDASVTEGDEEGTIEVTIVGNDDFVNDRNGKLYAISYVEFECVQEEV